MRCAGAPLLAACATFAVGVEHAEGASAVQPCSTLVSAATVQRVLGVSAEHVAGPAASVSAAADGTAPIRRADPVRSASS